MIYKDGEKKWYIEKVGSSPGLEARGRLLEITAPYHPLTLQWMSLKSVNVGCSKNFQKEK